MQPDGELLLILRGDGQHGKLFHMEQWPSGEWRYRVRQGEEVREYGVTGREATFVVWRPGERVEVEWKVGGEWVPVREVYPEVSEMKLRLELNERLVLGASEVRGWGGRQGVTFMAPVWDRVAVFAREGGLDLEAGTHRLVVYPVVAGMGCVVGAGEFVIEEEWGRCVNDEAAVVEWRDSEEGRVRSLESPWVYMVKRGSLPRAEVLVFREMVERLGR